MSLNLAYKRSRFLQIAASGKSSGDVVNVNGIVGIAQHDTDSDGNVEIDLGHEVSVYTLSVVGVDATGNSAVAIGDRLYLDGAVVNKDSANGVFIGRALAAVSSGATTSIKVVVGSGIAGPVRDLKSISLDVAFGGFTDNADATGYADFAASSLPAGAIPFAWKAVVATGFTGNTSAVIQVGVSGDLDRFSGDTAQSVLAAGTVGSMALAADALDGIAAAQTPRVTVTGATDFTSISAGSMIVTLYYFEG